MKKIRLLGAMCACISCIAFNASASSITYGGDLTSGALFVGGSVNILDHNSPSLWNVGNLWTISVNAGDILTITGRRLTDFDPIMSLWDGTETDTAAYTSYFSNSASTQHVAIADDNLASNIPSVQGCCGDPQIVYTALTTGIYTVGLFGLGGDDNIAHSYSITASGATGTVSAVPVPAAVWLFGSGLIGLIGVARRKKV